MASFENLLNFRDVSATINGLAGRRLLQEGLLFRSARPDDASQSDRSLLTDKLGIKTIIDLRSKTEHINQAKKRQSNTPSSELVPQSNASASDPVKLPGIRYAEISLTGSAFERALLWKLGWRDIGKLLGLMAAGYRNEGISILGKNVMQPRGLVGLGEDTLDHSHKEVRQIFDVLSDPASYPVLVHCTQGKDRTGITILLVLALLHVDKQLISTDYMMSEKELEPEFEDRMKEIEAIGLNEDFARCPSDFVDRICDYIQTRYGSVSQYLELVSVNQDMQEAVRRRLLAQA